MLTLFTVSIDTDALELPYSLITWLRTYIVRGYCNPSPMLPRTPKNINSLSLLSAYRNMLSLPPIVCAKSRRAMKLSTVDLASSMLEISKHRLLFICVVKEIINYLRPSLLYRFIRYSLRLIQCQMHLVNLPALILRQGIKESESNQVARPHFLFGLLFILSTCWSKKVAWIYCSSLLLKKILTLHSFLAFKQDSACSYDLLSKM